MQSKKHSAIETVTGTAIGFFVSWAATPLILWCFGYSVSAAKSFGITVVYTVLSMVRGYCVRRWFNRMQARR